MGTSEQYKRLCEKGFRHVLSFYLLVLIGITVIVLSGILEIIFIVITFSWGIKFVRLFERKFNAWWARW